VLRVFQPYFRISIFSIAVSNHGLRDNVMGLKDVGMDGNRFVIKVLCFCLFLIFSVKILFWQMSENPELLPFSRAI
jgi:hypothetical protein